jgi:hypothetical protein
MDVDYASVSRLGCDVYGFSIKKKPIKDLLRVRKMSEWDLSTVFSMHRHCHMLASTDWNSSESERDEVNSIVGSFQSEIGIPRRRILHRTFWHEKALRSSKHFPMKLQHRFFGAMCHLLTNKRKLRSMYRTGYYASYRSSCSDQS